MGFLWYSEMAFWASVILEVLRRVIMKKRIRSSSSVYWWIREVEVELLRLWVFEGLSFMRFELNFGFFEKNLGAFKPNIWL